MKMNTVQRQYESTVSGPKIKMGFAADAASHLAELMSNSVYQDKYGSIVREVVSNAVDANVEAGSTQLVEVMLTDKRDLSNAVGEFSVRDYGPGITPNRIENIFTQYFASTKRDTNDQIGGFGIGAKSPFAYTPVFTVITYIDGTKRTYLLEKSSSDRTCTLIQETETEEHNGTKIVIPVYKKDDIWQFVAAMEQQLVLLNHLLSVTVPNDYEFAGSKVYDYGKFLVIVRSDRVIEHHGIMVSLGNVLYKISAPDKEYCNTNYVIKLNIGEVNPTLSREGLEMTDAAKDLIRQKCAEVEQTFHQWSVEKSGETTDMTQLVEYGYGNENKLCYPNFSAVHQIMSLDRHDVHATPKGWPSELDQGLFRRICNQAIDISSRYDFTKNKWRSASMYTLRDLAHPAKFKCRPLCVRKRHDQRLGSVWKEYFADTVKPHADQLDAVVFSVTSDLDVVVDDILRYTLRDYSQEECDAIHDQVVTCVTNCFNNWFQTHTSKYDDYTPTSQWLEARKARMKLSRKSRSSWTKEMLETKVPTKDVSGNAYRRESHSYNHLKKMHAVIVRLKHAKAIDWSQRSMVHAVSDQNFKRCQKAGLQCLDLPELSKAVARWDNHHEDLAGYERIINRLKFTSMNLTRTVLNRLEGVINLPTQPERNAGTTLPIQYINNRDLFGLKSRKPEEDSILQVNGVVYSLDKIQAQFRNLQKQSEKSPIHSLAFQAATQQYIADDLYRQALISLK